MCGAGEEERVKAESSCRCLCWTGGGEGGGGGGLDMAGGRCMSVGENSLGNLHLSWVCIGLVKDCGLSSLSRGAREVGSEREWETERGRSRDASAHTGRLGPELEAKEQRENPPVTVSAPCADRLGRLSTQGVTVTGQAGDSDSDATVTAGMGKSLRGHCSRPSRPGGGSSLLHARKSVPSDRDRDGGATAAGPGPRRWRAEPGAAGRPGGWTAAAGAAGQPERSEAGRARAGQIGRAHV